MNRARLVALSALALVSCGRVPPKATGTTAPPRTTETAPTPQSTPATGFSRAPTADESRVIRGLMRDTERIRGLSFRAPIDVRIQDRAAMRTYVSHALEEGVLARARRRYVALGLIDPTLDVRELLESLMEEELIGYYDPKQKRLAVRDDVARSLGDPAQGASDLEWRVTVVHELVHALQDQHLGLAQAMAVERSTDADDAFGALVEGDATLAMLGYAAELAGVSMEALAADPKGLALSLHVSPDRLTGSMRTAPAIVRESLLFRYREGALFAARLLGKGGWEQVDEAHGAPPTSTLSVLAPEQYLAQTPSPSISLPALTSLAQHGYVVVDEDVLGSFETSIVLQEAGISPRVTQPAWRGDRYAVLKRERQLASVWCMRWNTATVARRVAAALPDLRDNEDHPRIVLREGCHVMVLREVGAEPSGELEQQLRAWARGER